MDRKPVIVYCTPSLYIPGGIERVLTTKANYRADVAGYTVYIILTDGQDKSPYYPLSSQIRLIQLGIEFEELLDEIEAIVYSGTKLNIDYFLEDIMDEDHLLDIYDYFKESTTDKIDDALDELGDDFTEEEVRLVRIKFISEMAN